MALSCRISSLDLRASLISLAQRMLLQIQKHKYKHTLSRSRINNNRYQSSNTPKVMIKKGRLVLQLTREIKQVLILVRVQRNLMLKKNPLYHL